MATGDKYVMNGVWLTCDKGVTPSRFNVTPKPVQLYDEDFANELDKLPMVNILPFGVCSVTRTPCMPAPVLWERVMEDGLTVLGARPLLDTSKCMCGVGGKIAIHFTRADASAAVALDQKLDKVDEVADAVEEASGWAFWGGLAMGIGGAILVATGVGAPLGAAMITGAGYLMTASTIAATAAVVAKGATKFARDPSKEVGLSIVGEIIFEAAKNYVMNKLGGKILQKLGRAAQKAMNRLGLSERACKLANRLLCSTTGHPVDVISGYLYTEAIDFELPGPIPLRWERLWNSTSIHDGPLGHGWHHVYDMALSLEEEEQVVAFRAADGRGIAFNLVPLGQRDYNRLEKLTLLHDEQGYAVLDHAKGLIYRFGLLRGDEVARLAAIEHPNGFAIRFQYDGAGRLLEIEDSARRQLSVSSDEHGRIRTITTAHPTEPRQRVTLVEYRYNRRGELVSAHDALGQAATFRYENRLLVQETFKHGLNFYFQYQGVGPEARCVRTWGDGGIYDHKLLYDVAAHRTEVINSLGHSTVYIGNENGLVVETIDARGGVTLTEYNDYNELLSATDPLGNQLQYAYDERGNQIMATRADGATLQLQFDEADRPVAVTDTVGGQWQWRYDAAGNVIESTNPLGSQTRYAYENGLLRRLTDAGQQATEFRYDPAGNLLEVNMPDGQQRRRLYDGWGRMLKTTDARGNVQWCEYDLLNRLVKLYEPDGNVRQLTYDPFDNLVRSQDRYSDVRYAYQGMGRLIRRVEAGTAIEFLHDTEEQLRAVVNEHGLTYRFELDALGEVVTETGFDGLTRRYQRDAGGRIIELQLPTAARTRYTYDQAGRVTAVTYDDGSSETYEYRTDDMLLQATNATRQVRYVRDVLGQVLQEFQGEHVVSSDYDALGRRIRVASSLGADVHISRSAAGHVEQVKSGDWQARFARDAQGLELQRTYSGGTQMRWKRDALGRPVEQRTRTGQRTEDRVRTYGWLPADRLAHIQDNLYGTTRFEHDARGYLTTTVFGDGSRQLRQPDAVGNLFRSETRQDRRYGPAGQLLAAGGTHYHYDAAGNLARKVLATGEEWQYHWDSAGHLAEVIRPDGATVRFTYDALGRRVSKQYQGQVTTWLWDNNVPLHEWQPAGPAAEPAEELVTWLFEEDSFAPLARLQGPRYHNIVCDHLGAPLELTDHQGKATWQAELDSYGNVRRLAAAAPADCPFRFPGQYEDFETGLYYNHFRYYDPEGGQYISQDPIRLRGGLQLHGYVPDPLSWVDTTGLSGYVLGQNLLKSGQTHGISPFNRTTDWQAHHLIPEEVWGQNKQFFKDIGIRGRDNARNGIFLPSTEALGNQHGFGTYHLGSHATYSASVARQVASVETDFRSGAITKSEAKQQIHDLQDNLRNRLNIRTNGTGCRRLT